MSMLVTADIHLTDNVRDSYRWDLIPWIQEKVIEHSISQVLILGDSTDQKDNHSANLVNRFIQQITELGTCCDVFILYGNHDGISEPFFGFIEEFKSNVTFISKVSSWWLRLPTKGRSIHCLFLPCTRNWEEDWNGIDFDQYDLIFTHQTYNGARSETGILLPGIPPSVFEYYRGKVYSGDIHVPQKVGPKIEYVGSPYRIRFGDQFEPRVIVLDDDLRRHSIYFRCLSKHVLVCSNLEDMVEQADKLKVKSGDQVKVRVSLARHDLPSWKGLKEQVKQKAIELGWQLFGPELLPIKDAVPKETEATAVYYRTSEQILADFISAKRLSDKQADIGLSLIKSL